MFKSKSPKAFLGILQNGTKPALPDLRLIEDIAIKFQLNNGVINALIDYVLTSNNNVLSRALCEKIAASIAREGVQTALDTMNYLKSINEKGKTKTKTTVKIKVQPKVEDVVVIEPNTQEEEDDFNWEEVVKQIDG